jgi:hypothetical protein
VFGSFRAILKSSCGFAKIMTYRDFNNFQKLRQLVTLEIIGHKHRDVQLVLADALATVPNLSKHRSFDRNQIGLRNQAENGAREKPLPAAIPDDEQIIPSLDGPAQAGIWPDIR